MRITEHYYFGWLFSAVGLSLALSVGSAELWRPFLRVEPSGVIGYKVVSALGTLALAAPLLVIYLGVKYSIAPRRPKLLRYVLSAYGGVALSFAGVYYNLCFWGDFTDAVGKYAYYRLAAMREPEHPLAP